MLQLGFSLLGIAALWSSALGLIAAAIAQKLGFTAIQGDPTPMILVATAGMCNGFLLLPSAFYALRRLMGKQVGGAQRGPRSLLPVLLVLLMPVVLLAGRWILSLDDLGWLLLPPLHVLGVGLPVVWLSYLALRGLPLGTAQRIWGVFNTGSTLAPFFILILELGVLMAGILAWATWAASDPNLVSQIYDLGQRLEQAGNSPELVLHLLMPYIKNPLALFASLVFGAVIVPLIEEALKPLGVWLLAGSRLTPEAGFAAGILCGAGYALAESLVLSSNAGSEWVSLVVARVGTGVVHILTSGLSGWALALTWRNHRRHGLAAYIRLGLVYLLAVLIHGLWNGFTVAMVFASLLQSLGETGWSLLVQANGAAPYVLVAISILGLGVLVWANWHLRSAMKAQEAVV